ncbi:MAG: bifunctional phosphopantothenoylcysteine decarboxylase/phosphopantothenate--cysteine ligase CoaBC [Bacteroidales bacterium]|nr:bifunctional phosphopantothenoylcysteine decarboxylase/phosphopantothenate--cysteine ligase CoaBC [Bacteroidales bacterium]
MLKGKKILIGITGSIAAYKVPFIIRLLKKAGAEVQVIMTPMACDFVTPLTLSTLTERPVLVNFFDKGDGSWHSHVDLGLWADVYLLAPVSANTMAKMAAGIADNLLLTTVLSARCPLFFAPAMDLDMYQHPTTQDNIKRLQEYGYELIEPTQGELASGLHGFGRLEEPEVIFQRILGFFDQNRPLAGKKCLVTAGPTYEPIDPVRFIGNHSTGLMGIEVAKALADLGAEVQLVLGPSSIQLDNSIINVTRVTTSGEMLEACNKNFDSSDITVMAAAVADFRPVVLSDKKMKKSNMVHSLEVEPTTDILATLGKRKQNHQLLIGFALETDDEVAHATGKLTSKNLDMVVLNSLNDAGAGFGHATNKISLLTRNNDPVVFPLKSKKEVARDIVNAIIALKEIPKG